MPARAEILTFKHDIAELKADPAVPRLALCDKLFENYLGYASANWDYAAQPGGLTADALLAGTGRKTVACGTLREALKKMFREDIGCVEAKNADLNEYFITKPDAKCFDSKVRGNVGNRGSGTFSLGCHFSSHFFLECGGKYYDACLSTTYSNDRAPIFQTTRQVGSLTEPLAGVRYAGVGKATIVLRLIPNRIVPGFGSVWEILKFDEAKAFFKGAELTRFKATPAFQGL